MADPHRQTNELRPMIAESALIANDRRRIEAAVATVLAEEGYDGASVSEMVRRAHVGRSTFYTLYSSREKAIAATIRSAVRDAILRVEPADSAAARAHAFWEFLRENPDRTRAILLAGPRLIEVYATEQDRVAKLLGRSPRADLLVGSIEWILRQHLVRGGSLDEELREELRRFLFHYFGASLGEEPPGATLKYSPHAPFWVSEHPGGRDRDHVVIFGHRSAEFIEGLTAGAAEKLAKMLNANYSRRHEDADYVGVCRICGKRHHNG